MMEAMPYGDDLDARFHELVAQFSEEERRRLSAAASKGVRAPRRRRRVGRIWYAVAAVLAVVLAALLIVVFRPGLVSPSPELAPEPTAPILHALSPGPWPDVNGA